MILIGSRVATNSGAPGEIWRQAPLISSSLQPDAQQRSAPAEEDESERQLNWLPVCLAGATTL